MWTHPEDVIMLREEPDAEGQTRCGPTQVGTQRSQSHTDRKWGPGPPGGAGSEGVMGTGWQLGRWRVLEMVVAKAAQPCDCA